MKSQINITKKDVLWGYIAQFFSIGSGIIILPVILKFLSPDEVGFYYVLLSVSSIATIADLGFKSQISKTITYVYSGVPKVIRSGIDESSSSDINLELLSLLLYTTRKIYSRISVFVFILLSTLGTFYILNITDISTSIEGLVPIWCIFILSVCLQFFYSYYNSFLVGSGKLKESRKAIIFSQVIKIGLSVSLILWGWGLFGVIFSGLVSPVILRFFSQRYFFTAELKENIKQFGPSKQKATELFWTLWHNTKKAGFCSICLVLIYQLPVLFITSYLDLKTVASYCLLAQIVFLFASISGVFYTTIQPSLIMHLVKNENTLFVRKFAFSILQLVVILWISNITLLMFGDEVLSFFSKSTLLPSAQIVLCYMIGRFLVDIFWSFVQVSIMRNEYPFLKDFIAASLGLVALTWVSLHFTNLGILGVVLAFIIPFIFISIKWIIIELRSIKTSFSSFVILSLKEMIKQLNTVIKSIQPA